MTVSDKWFIDRQAVVLCDSLGDRLKGLLLTSLMCSKFWIFLLLRMDFHVEVSSFFLDLPTYRKLMWIAFFLPFNLVFDHFRHDAEKNSKQLQYLVLAGDCEKRSCHNQAAIIIKQQLLTDHDDTPHNSLVIVIVVLSFVVHKEDKTDDIYYGRGDREHRRHDDA